MTSQAVERDGAVESKDFSPEALAARLGSEAYEFAVNAALAAPAPSPAKVEAVRRILARSVADAARQSPQRAERPQVSRAA